MGCAQLYKYEKYTPSNWGFLCFFISGKKSLISELDRVPQQSLFEKRENQMCDNIINKTNIYKEHLTGETVLSILFELFHFTK